MIWVQKSRRSSLKRLFVLAHQEKKLDLWECLNHARHTSAGKMVASQRGLEHPSMVQEWCWSNRSLSTTMLGREFLMKLWKPLTRKMGVWNQFWQAHHWLVCLKSILRNLGCHNHPNISNHRTHLCRIMYVIRQWRKLARLKKYPLRPECYAVCRFFWLLSSVRSTNLHFRPSRRGYEAEKCHFLIIRNISICLDEATKKCWPHEQPIHMATVEGFCLKCKTYGPIKDGQLIKMKNGRTRMAGFCSEAGCTGKISKIVSWIILVQPMRFNTPVRRPIYLGARGLGVMTSPWHGEDREFNSLRAHHSTKTPLHDDSINKFQ